MTIAAPAFKPHLAIHPIDDGVILVSERKSSFFKGKIYSALAHLVDGQRSVEDIACSLKDTAKVTEVEQALNSLAEHGYLTDGQSNLLPAEAAFWSAFGLEKEPQQQLKKTAVDVVAVGDVPADACRELLSTYGLNVSADATFHLLVVDDYLNPQIAELNRHYFDRKESWMLVKPGSIIWIGPLFQPGKGACWECLAARLRINRPGAAAAMSNPNSVKRGSPGHFSLAVAPAMSLAALESAKWITSTGKQLADQKLLTLDLQQFQLDSHLVSGNPRCTVCGSQPEANPEIRMASRKKQSGENGYRSCSAEETLARLSPHISPITGIITSLTKTNRRRGEDDSPIQSYVAWHRGSSKPNPYAGRAAGGFELAFGKGMTDTQAKVSCVAEAIERYSGAYNSSDPRVVSRFADLPGAIHPRELTNFSEQQYQNRDRTNDPEDLFNWVPVPFDESKEIEWTPVWSLTEQAVRYLPSAFCFYYYPQNRDERFCIANSNGCASGNNVEEATLQGLLELVERDATAVWWYNRLQLPEVDIASFNDPYFQNLHKHVTSQGRNLKVIDITHDLGIPTFAAVSWKDHGRSILFGLGTHLEAKIGVSRAISELTQRLSFAERVERGDNDNFGSAERRIAAWLRDTHIDTQPHLVPLSNEPRTASHYTGAFVSDDLLDDVNHIVDRLKKLGLNVLLHDVTQPDIALSVVRVTVPGLRHFWARLGQGRLYEVPVKMGWLDRPRAEEDMNPVAYFL